MGWKVPIDTDIKDSFEFSAFEEALWSYILVRLRREEVILPLRAGNKIYKVSLKKGSMVLNVSKYTEEMGCSKGRVESALQIINQNAYNLRIVRKPYGLIIEPLNPDQFLKFELVSKMKGNRKQNESETIYMNNNVRTKEGGRDPHRLLNLDDDSELVLVPPVPATPHGSKVLKDYMGIKEWVDPQNEIQCAKDLEFLEDEIGIEEFNRRFQELLADPFHSKRFNEIKYIYLQMRSYKSKIN